jgi:thiosulfate reductase cytochrome b subunit
MATRTLLKVVHWSLLVLAVLVVVTGLGITEYRTVEVLTFGLLGKALAFKLHLWLWAPFLLLLALHVLLASKAVRRLTRKHDSDSSS